MSFTAGDILDQPPFPILKWNDYFWASSIVLRSWAGFQSRQGPYESMDKPTTSDGSVKLISHTPSEEPYVPSAEQIAAYQHLVAQQEYVRDSLLQTILDHYPIWREKYKEDCSAEEAEDAMPPIGRPEHLKGLIGLGIAHIHTVSKDGMTYVGYEFGCDWEEEHGLGAMTHNGRIVDMGSADTAILEWIAREDAEEGESI